MKTLLQIISAVLLVSALCACSSGKTGAFKSYVASSFPASLEARIAEDLADELAGIYPPGHTSLHLALAGTSDNLGQSLEQSLRVRGFSIADSPGSGVKTVAYVLDKIEDSYWYTRLTVSGGLVVTRTYSLSGDVLEAQASARTGKE